MAGNDKTNIDGWINKLNDKQYLTEVSIGRV